MRQFIFTVVFCLIGSADLHAITDISFGSEALPMTGYSSAALDELGWKVNDAAFYKVVVNKKYEGTAKIFIRRRTRQGFWIRKEIKVYDFQKQIDMFFDNKLRLRIMRVDGKNRKSLGQSQYTVKEMAERRPSVPAGRFRSLYVNLKDRSTGETVRLWVNPERVPVFGVIKLITQSNEGPAVFTLTRRVKN